MVSKLVITFALLISGVSFRAGFAQSICPTVVHDSLAVSGQSLPLIRVGNVQISQYPTTNLNVSPAGRNTVNVRVRPSAQAALVGSIPVDGRVTADARNSDGSWLHVQLADGSMGWVSASVIKVDGDIPSLASRSSDDSAFPSSAGFDLTASPDTNCPNAPNGVLLQTPDGMDTLILNVDGVILDLNKATVFISDDEQGLGIVVLKGTVLLQSASEVTPIEAGMETHLTRSADGRATGKPDTPFGSAPSFIAQLPISQLGSDVESTPIPAETQSAAASTTLADNYVFAIDSSTPSACVSGEFSGDEAAQEGQRLTQNLPPWATPVRYLQPNESIDVPVISGGTQTVSAITNEQVVTLTVEDFAKQTMVALTQVAPYRYEFFQTVDENSIGYRVDTSLLPTLKLTLIFNYQVTVRVGGENVEGSSRSCQDFEVYLTGTPQG